jgi:hypothetical protein
MPEPVVIVGLCGAIEAGKDSFASVLSAVYGFQRISLGDGPKGLFSELSGPQQNLHKELQAHGKTLRWGWQQTGSEAREAVCAPLLWVERSSAGIYYLSRLHPVTRHLYVAPDVRFPHETDCFCSLAKALGGFYYGVLVERTGYSSEGETHGSEAHYNKLPVQFSFRNDGTRRELVAVADALMARLEKLL